MDEKICRFVTLLAGLLKGAYTHGCDPTTARHGNFWLLGFLPGPIRSSLDNLNLDPPGSTKFLQSIHVDTKLNADTCSTQATIQQDFQPQALHYIKPPRNRIRPG